MSGALEGRIALVTGAASGIGRAITARFVREGAGVLGFDRDEPGLAKTGRLVGNGPGRMVPLVGDVTARDAPALALAACHDALGVLDILVNNAGIGAAKPVHDTDDDELDRFLDVNVRSVFRMTRAALADMRGRGGAIVNLSSIYGLRGFPTSSIYSATKSALIGLTQNMAADYGPEGVRVNAIAPGVIRTPLTRERLETNAWFRDTLIGGTPLGRVGEPEEIAAAALFLSSEEASFITGQVLAVDGGWSNTKFAPGPQAGA